MTEPQDNQVRCSICGTQLDVDNDPTSADCGGDCWGCIGEMEANMFYEPSLNAVRKEYLQGYRPNWIPAPNIELLRNSSLFTARVILLDQLGEPWVNKPIDIALFVSDEKGAEKERIFEDHVTTNDEGTVDWDFELQKSYRSKNVWVQVTYDDRSWAKPLQEEC